MLKIRRYTEKDIPVLIEMIRTEVPKLKNYTGITIEPDRVEFMFRQSLKDESTYMAHVVDKDGEIVGGIAGYCVTQLLSWDKYCCDIFQFVKEGHRSIHIWRALVRSYKDWAIRRGAKMIDLGCSSGYHPELIGEMIKREGFEHIGSQYRLCVSHTKQEAM